MRELLLRKITSRKFWLSVAAFVTSILTAYNVSDSVIAQAGIIIAGIASICVYVHEEGVTDRYRH